MLSLEYDSKLMIDYIYKEFDTKTIIKDNSYFPIISDEDDDNWYKKIMSTVFLCKIIKDKYKK